MSEKQQIDTEVKLENVGLIEIPKFDPKPFIGTKVKIEKVTEHRGQFGFYIKIQTEKVTEFAGKDIRAVKPLGLYEDSVGNIGWGEDTKTGVFLTAMGVEHYKDLVGKEVILQTKLNKEGVEFLDF